MFTNKKIADTGPQIGIPVSSVPSKNVLARMKFQKTSSGEVRNLLKDFLKFSYLRQESGQLLHYNIEITEL